MIAFVLPIVHRGDTDYYLLLPATTLQRVRSIHSCPPVIARTVLLVSVGLTEV